MDGLDEYENKFKRMGIKSPTKAEIESYRPWSKTEPSQTLQGFAGARDQRMTMIPEKPGPQRAQEASNDGQVSSRNDSRLESDRKKLATRIRENMRVRNSFSFDPMATKLLFAGLNIYVEIEDDDAEYAEEVRKLCTKLGAVIQARFIYGKRAEQSLKPDLIVWHRGEFKTLEKAEANQIPVVNHNWVFECISKQSKLPFDQFKLSEYEKEEAKTRNDLGIGTRRRILANTRRLVNQTQLSNSEQKQAPPKPSENQAAGVPVQTHLSFTKPSESARNLIDSQAVLPPNLASTSRFSHQTDPNSRRTLPTIQKSVTGTEGSSTDKSALGPSTKAKVVGSGATTSTKPETVPATTSEKPAPALDPKPRSHPSHYGGSLAEQIAEQIRALCAEPSELRDMVLHDEGLCRDLQIEASPDPAPPRKSGKPLRKPEEAVEAQDRRPVQQTLSWGQPQPRPSAEPQPSVAFGPRAELLPVTKFLRANNPQFMSSSKTASKIPEKPEISDSQSLTSLESKEVSRVVKYTLTLFYCGAYKTVAQLKGLKVDEGSGLSIIRSGNFHQYQLKPEETIWFYDGSEPGDLGLLWAIINKVPILSPKGVEKLIKHGKINVKELAGDQLVRVEWASPSSLSSLFDDPQSKSRLGATCNTIEISLSKHVLDKTYLNVFTTEGFLRRKEYAKLVETLQAVVEHFGGKLTKDSYLLDITVVTDDDLKSQSVLKLLQHQNSTGAAKVVRTEWLVDSIFDRYKKPTGNGKYRIDHQK